MLELIEFLIFQVLHQQILMPVFGNMTREHPEMIVGIRRHVRECELFLLRLVRIEFQ